MNIVSTLQGIRFVVVRCLHILFLIFKGIAAVAITGLAIFGLVYLVSPAERRQKLWTGFQKFGRVIGTFNARVILTLFYALFIAPYALLMKPFIDPLRIRSRQTWLLRATTDLTLDDARKQS